MTTGEVTKYYRAGAQTVAMRKVLVPQYDTLTYLLGDHLGSTSIATDDEGNLITETRYKPWGEVRYTTDNSTLPTRYTYTGQYSYMDDPATDLGGAGFGLMFYNARWYDPVLGRFNQPDTIVPEQSQGTQAWDRYAYVSNNPVLLNDPTGHCPVCIVAAVFIIGAVVLTGDTPQIKPGDAGNIVDLVTAGLQHDKHANIVNEGLQSLQADPSVQAAQTKIVDAITKYPEYGEQSFSIESGPSGQFTANGPSRNWKQAAITGNQAFWMVHVGTISATNTTVSADGTISTTWNIHDKFDFIPGSDHTDEYNSWASIVHQIYNDLLGAEESYPTDAYWDETIPPQKKKSNPK